MLTFCVVVPVLVIVVLKSCRRSLLTALNALTDFSSVVPVAAGEPSEVLIDSASWTAL